MRSRFPFPAAALAALVILLHLAPASLAAAEYLTEYEIDQIRETQEIERRIPLFLKFAEARLIRLGLIEPAESARNPEKKAGLTDKVAKGIAVIFQPEAARQMEEAEAAAEEGDDQLSVYSKTELLLGFHQALEEAMDNLDDAYERKRGDIRKPLEELKEFTERTIPILKKFEAVDKQEDLALRDALKEAEIALEGAEKALKIIPKTPNR